VGVDWHRRDGGIQPLNLRRVAIAEPPQEPAEPGTVLEGARVACGSGAIQLREVQLPGKSTLPIERFVTGHPLHPGEKLVPPEPANEPTS